MELPIFSDNLRSSGTWSASLGRAREAWLAGRAALEPEVRREQARHARARSGGRLGEARLLEAARLVGGWAAAPEAMLTQGQLIGIYRALTGAVGEESLFRMAEAVPLSPAHNPAPAVILPRLVANALDWFTTEGFAEMHPVEQAALVHLRLHDLQPFGSAHEPVALLAAGFYTERAGLPPLIIHADEATGARYAAAVEAALRMLTQPLVEFFAASLSRTMRMGSGDEG